MLSRCYIYIVTRTVMNISLSARVRGYKCQQQQQRVDMLFKVFSRDLVSHCPRDWCCSSWTQHYWTASSTRSRRMYGRTDGRTYCVLVGYASTLPSFLSSSLSLTNMCVHAIEVHWYDLLSSGHWRTGARVRGQTHFALSVHRWTHRTVSGQRLGRRSGGDADRKPNGSNHITRQYMMAIAHDVLSPVMCDLSLKRSAAIQSPDFNQPSIDKTVQSLLENFSNWKHI